MANASGWNPSDKDSAVVLADHALYGDDSVASNTSVAGWRSVRSAASFSSGKYVFEFYSRNVYDTGNGGCGFAFGVANGSASLGGLIGADSNGYSLAANQIATNGLLYSYYGASSVYSDGGTALEAGGTVGQLAINADASPKRAYWRWAFRHNGVTGVTAWRDFAGNLADPTNSAEGTDISALGTPLYVTASSYFITPTAPEIILNSGGWPFLTEYMSLPSGYTGLDANYPFSVPPGSYPFAGTTGGGSLSQNDMRFYNTTNPGGSFVAYPTTAFPSEKIVFGAMFDHVNSETGLSGFGVSSTTGTTTSSPYWRNDGTWINATGTGWPSYKAGEPIYLLLDRPNARLFGTKDFATFYGASGSGANPNTPADGIDLSGYTNIATAGPAAVFSGDDVSALTLHTGTIVDAASLPSGYEWLDTNIVPTTGTATGVGTASAGGASLGIASGAGAAVGTGSAAGSAALTSSAAGTATGTGTASGAIIATGVIQAFGAAFGVGSASAFTAATGNIQAAGTALGVGSASGVIQRKFEETVSELPTVAGAVYPASVVVVTQNVTQAGNPTYAWRPGAIVEEVISQQESLLSAVKYAQLVSEAPTIAAVLTSAFPKTLSETMTYTAAASVVRGWLVLEALNIVPAAAARMSYRPTLTDILQSSPELLRFVAGGIAETVTYTDAATQFRSTPKTLADALTFTDTLTPRLVFRMTAAETVDLDHVDALKMFFRPTLEETIDISTMHITPDGTVTTWVVNTRTGGTTEYTNYNFNSFVRMGNKVLGASASGLFELNGDDDDGTPILSVMRSGYAQFGNGQFSSLRGAYLGVRATGVFVFKVLTGDGKTYVYQVNGNRMTSTKVNIGKGIRARYIAYELQNLDGQDFDLDSVEFLPVVAQRRV
jgi:hypothetical protein